MKTITNTFRVSINARPEAVFAYVSDLTRHGEWNSGLQDRGCDSRLSERGQ
jgi:hypothetical protein